ncbi:MAG: glycosyl transferase family protein [Gammaproteobacteria bacterium]|nr:MAG: glycosyl transferase family protein [Gammaproteobacteria bacterium]
MSDAIAYLLVACELLTAVVGVVFLISGIDDLFIDICYLARVLYKRLFVAPRYPALREQALRARPEQPIAVMIPAWQESSVIRQMLLNTRSRLDYTNYVIFVGTYPNDPATAREVDGLEEVGARVIRVTVPHPGPTNKADCLNWIYHAIRRYEAVEGIAFQIFVMQDCEDVIHPLCYRLFNYLIPRKDMVQLPVLSLERRWREFTGGHYLDEFAQLHYKDLVVRELLDRSLPAAGVGVAFSRRALAAVAAANRGEIFSTKSLTEDYDFGFRLKRLGMRQIFVKFEVVRDLVVRGDAESSSRRTRRVRELVGVREYFPATLRSAIRQKSRWVIGIAMQGWSHLGWSSDWRTNYMLYRDRKPLITNLATVGGYGVVSVVLSVWVMQWLWPDAYRFPPIVQRGSTLWYMLMINFALLVLRVLQRGYCVWRLHGYRQAALSIPRMAWANFVNFAATVRAVRLYLRYLHTGRAIAWDKTDHIYPALESIPFRRPRGEAHANGQTAPA